MAPVDDDVLGGAAGGDEVGFAVVGEENVLIAVSIDVPDGQPVADLNLGIDRLVLEIRARSVGGGGGGGGGGGASWWFGIGGRVLGRGREGGNPTLYD